MYDNEIYKLYNSTHIGRKIDSFCSNSNSAANKEIPVSIGEDAIEEYDIEYNIYRREYYSDENAVIGSILVSIVFDYDSEPLLELFYKYSKSSLEVWDVRQKEKGIAASIYNFFNLLYKAQIYSMRGIRDYMEKYLYYFPIISLPADVEEKIIESLSKELQRKQKEIEDTREKERELRRKKELLCSIREDIIGGKE